MGNRHEPLTSSQTDRYDGSSVDHAGVALATRLDPGSILDVA
jgi:hypothetical protein